MRLWFDIESKCPIAIRRGTYLYSRHATPILWQWAIDDGPVVYAEGPEMPLELYLLMDSADEIWAHNANFDRVMVNVACIKQGLPLIPLEKWRCTAALARMHGLPGGLDKLCQIFRIPAGQAKDHAGKNLIQFFCVQMNDPAQHPELWQAFINYGVQDVVAMRAIYGQLPRWNAGGPGWAKWHQNQKMNDRGVYTDILLANNIVEATTKARKQLDAQTGDIAQLIGNNEESELERLTQVARLKDYLAEAGIDLPNLTAETVERRLEDETLPAHCRWLLTARQEVARASTSKARRLLECVEPDNRLRGMLTACGAQRTGRAAGAMFQPLNLPRPKHEQADIDIAIEYLLSGSLDMLDPEHVMGYSADALRGLLVASPGRKLLSVDWSAIEGRGTAWHSGEEWVLDVYRNSDLGIGPKPYAVAYAVAFAIDAALVKKGSFEYQIGKVMELALGYQGAVGAFAAMVETYKLRIPELAKKAYPTLPKDVWDKSAEAYANARARYGLEPFDWRVLWCLVQLWRRSRPATCAYWYRIEDAFRACALGFGKDAQVGKMRFFKRGSWVLMQLPSGRALCYPNVQVDINDNLSFLGVNPYTKQWGRIPTYGGKLTENIMQATAVDFHDESLLEAEAAGLNPVLSVYDEINCDAEMDRSVKELEEIMCRPRPWADGFPLAVEGWEGPRYHK